MPAENTMHSAKHIYKPFWYAFYGFWFFLGFLHFLLSERVM